MAFWASPPDGQTSLHGGVGRIERLLLRVCPFLETAGANFRKLGGCELVILVKLSCFALTEDTDRDVM